MPYPVYTIPLQGAAARESSKALDAAYHIRHRETEEATMRYKSRLEQVAAEESSEAAKLKAERETEEANVRRWLQVDYATATEAQLQRMLDEYMEDYDFDVDDAYHADAARQIAQDAVYEARQRETEEANMRYKFRLEDPSATNAQLQKMLDKHMKDFDARREESARLEHARHAEAERLEHHNAGSSDPTALPKNDQYKSIQAVPNDAGSSNSVALPKNHQATKDVRGYEGGQTMSSSNVTPATRNEVNLREGVRGYEGGQTMSPSNITPATRNEVSLLGGVRGYEGGQTMSSSNVTPATRNEVNLRGGVMCDDEWCGEICCHDCCWGW